MLARNVITTVNNCIFLAAETINSTTLARNSLQRYLTTFMVLNRVVLTSETVDID